MSSTWTPPANYASRPVAVLGGGVLGRRIACCWASAGYTVHIRDPSATQRSEAVDFVSSNVSTYARDFTGCTNVGSAVAFENLGDAVADAWLVFEAVPEKLSIKIDTFAELEALAPADALLCSNSSSYKSSEMLEKVGDATKRRILNTHYFMPTVNMVVELMTDGYTEPAIFPFLVERHREAGLKPYVARKESTGFIFNRVWAAIKREFLMIMDEGVSVPQELDEVWVHMFGDKLKPCDMMDHVGLDTVAFIEQHYIKERGLPTSHLEYLQQHYVSKGKLGRKSAQGGFYPTPTTTNGTTTSPAAAAAPSPHPTITVLDIGLSAPLAGATTAADVSYRGRILSLTPNTATATPLLTSLNLPDGIVIDRAATPQPRMIWTHMGIPTANDGAVLSANLDGSDMRTLVPPGAGLHTPKQIALDAEARKLYVCDREGMRVHRCNMDGSELETIVQAGDWTDEEERQDQTRWCVGVAVAPALGRFFWTQKGPSKGGKGRIFSAEIKDPKGSVKCLLEGLPEPIDLLWDGERGELVWTDRGEVPFGNSLNRVVLDAQGEVVGKSWRVVAQNFDEAIGVERDERNECWYVADLGGTVWRVQEDGRKEVVYQDKECAFTGLALSWD
ncbi:3-hydroxyacyl-dehydrogenase [Lasiodiplodia theobromae]|uniref:3-hydroxyacyl-dehydrogenase n=1 Tax=Lasiodiplodia theobromae TaxID=45133 RepID=UPI0015C3915F|nr:3-hydroxyacyl-dehydrogenase [Lasiodiplodia theobromae]KAF4544364.1 3-hydroxyacyl-dehydrogenase [Lasiodiplodia theobromae]